MPRFDGYFKKMAELEKRLGDWKEAANRAIEEGSSAAPRATLDKITSEILTRMCPRITSPKNLYELVYEDIERLQKLWSTEKKAKKH